MEEYLSLRFRESAFMIEDQLNELSKDSNARTVIMNNRTTIMNNRPLALSNGAVFLSNSPFLTSLLFVVVSSTPHPQVKSPIVVSLISKQCGESYFIQLLASIVFICLHRLAEQAAIQRDLVSILPIAKLFSMRLCFIPQGLFSEPRSDALITHTPILTLLQQPANIALEQSSKRPRRLLVHGGSDGLPLGGEHAGAARAPPDRFRPLVSAPLPPHFFDARPLQRRLGLAERRSVSFPLI